MGTGPASVAFGSRGRGTSRVERPTRRRALRGGRQARGTGLKRAPRLGSVAQVADGFGSGPAGR